jgi:hypothetical protein
MREISIFWPEWRWEARKKLKFGFSGGFFALLFAQTKSKKKVEKEVTYPLANLVTS